MERSLNKHYQRAVRRFERTVLRRTVYAYGTAAYGAIGAPGKCRECGRHAKRRYHTHYVLERLNGLPHESRESRKMGGQLRHNSADNAQHCAACVLDFVMEHSD